jgi:hypothetical protein
MQAMKILAAALFTAAALPATAQPAPSQPPKHTNICLNIRDVQDTTSKDGKIMTFKMKDGTIYNNHLRENCSGLTFGGFAWTINPSQQVCEDVQSFRALATGEICRLGRFDAPIKKAAAAK